MQSQQLVNGNFVLGKAGLTGLSGAATTFTTGKAFDFAIGGKAGSKAAVAGGATPTTDAITGRPITISPGKGTIVLWCFDAAGNIKLVAGPWVAEFLNEIAEFPNAKHDDQVDALSGAFAELVTGSTYNLGTAL